MYGRVTGPNGVNSELKTTAISPAINTVRETPLDEKDKDILVALPKPKKHFRPLSNFGTRPYCTSQRHPLIVSTVVLILTKNNINLSLNVEMFQFLG